MSRPRRTPETAKADFIREVRIRRATIDMTQSDLAAQVGVVPSVMSVLLSEPDKISVGRLRKIVHTLSPDPTVVLSLLGYDLKEIRKLNLVESA